MVLFTSGVPISRSYRRLLAHMQTRPPLMYIRTLLPLGASLRFELCARRAMVRSSSGFKVKVEVGVILCLTGGAEPTRTRFGYFSSYRSIQSAANIKEEG